MSVPAASCSTSPASWARSWRTDTTRSASTSDGGGFVAGVVRRGNEELAGYVSAAPDRLVALGSVPLGWPGAADEARRCLDEHRMAGIAIGSRGGGRDLDDPVNDDLWALRAGRAAFVFLAPSGAGVRLVWPRARPAVGEPKR